jgi:hypothetical protein
VIGMDGDSLYYFLLSAHYFNTGSHCIYSLIEVTYICYLWRMVLFVFNKEVLHGLFGSFLVFQAGCFAYISDCVDFANKEALETAPPDENVEEVSSQVAVRQVSRAARFGQIDGILPDN